MGLDFRPSNILVKLTNLDHLTESQLLSLLIPPEKVQVQTESGKDVPASSPKYLVPPVDLSRLGNDYLTDNICVIDFGESFLISSPPESLGIPENYLPPEVLLDEDNAIGPACDLWALGCTLFEIRQQIPLFYMIFDRDELLAETVRFFGKLPMSWWEKWEAREEFFDEQGKWIRHGDTEEWTLEVLLSKNAEIVQPGKGDDPSKMNMVLATPKAEQRLMADLLYRLFCYNPASRASIKEVLEHEWFKM